MLAKTDRDLTEKPSRGLCPKTNSARIQLSSHDLKTIISSEVAKIQRSSVIYRPVRCARVHRVVYCRVFFRCVLFSVSIEFRALS